MPKISVIVPVYNVEPYIHRCVDSILNQTFTDFELILVDDGSPDNCGAICDEYAAKDNRIIVIHKENGGLSDARNAGIDWVFANSDSEWLSFIDSDDWIHSQYLYLLYSVAKENKLNIVSCRSVWTEYLSKECVLSDLDYIIDTPEQLLLNHSLDIASSCFSLYNKNLFVTARFPVGKLFEDLYTIPAILYSQTHTALILEKLYYRYVNPDSITHSNKTPKWINDLFEAHNNSLLFLGNNMFFPTFSIVFHWYKKYFSEFIKEYCDDLDYKHVFINNFNQALRIERQYKGLSTSNNTQLKKYGFKKWITGQADALEQLKTDSKNVADERGRLFALLWKIKNRISIYSYYRKMPV